MVEEDEGYAIIELIGEWNDCLHNDIATIKREIIDYLIGQGIYRYVLCCDNVLNFHGSDDSYYEEWWDDIKEDNGWIVFLNIHEHVRDEMESMRLQYYCNFGDAFQDFNWRRSHPKQVIPVIEAILHKSIKQLRY